MTKPTATPDGPRRNRHVAEYMTGYMSPRCLNGMDGCDDQACICRCHEEPSTEDGS